MKYMEKERKLIVEYGRKLIDKGLTVGTGGNISIFDRKSEYMAISPSGIPYYDMEEKDVVVMDLHGNIVEGELKPSSEYNMHTMVYKHRKDANAMIHTHALYSTTISCMRKSLPAVDYLVAHSGGKDVKCAEYATFGTTELAKNALRAMEGRKAVLLANHGINVIGEDIGKTFAITEQIEFCAQLFWQSKSMGEPVLLSDQEMERVVNKFGGYGQQ